VFKQQIEILINRLLIHSKSFKLHNGLQAADKLYLPEYLKINFVCRLIDVLSN